MPTEQAGEEKSTRPRFYRASTRLELTVNTGSASKRLYNTPLVPSPSDFAEADLAFP